MGFICPDCGKDFGTNKEWFEDHRFYHLYSKAPAQRIVVRVEEQKATLRSIRKSIKEGRIKVWMNVDGLICFTNQKGDREIRFTPYYDMYMNETEEGNTET